MGPEKGVTVNAGRSNQVFQVGSGVTASISGMTISGGNTGGLDNSTLGSTTVTGTNVLGNSAAGGGGISNQATLSVASSNISFNRAIGGTDGDGIGGGLYVTSGGVVTLKKSTVSLNLASTSNNDIFGTVTYL